MKWLVSISLLVGMVSISAILQAGMMYHAWGLWPTSWLAFWVFTFINGAFGYSIPFVSAVILERFISDE